MQLGHQPSLGPVVTGPDASGYPTPPHPAKKRATPGPGQTRLSDLRQKAALIRTNWLGHGSFCIPAQRSQPLQFQGNRIPSLVSGLMHPEQVMTVHEDVARRLAGGVPRLNDPENGVARVSEKADAARVYIVSLKSGPRQAPYPSQTPPTG